MNKEAVERRRALIRDMLLKDPTLYKRPMAVLKELKEQARGKYNRLTLQGVVDDINHILGKVRRKKPDEAPTDAFEELISAWRVYRTSGKKPRQEKTAAWTNLMTVKDRVDNVILDETFRRRKETPNNLKIMLRRNKLKQLLTKTQNTIELAEMLGTTRWTVMRDMKEIHREGLKMFADIDREDIFLEFMEEVDTNNRALAAAILGARADIDRIHPKDRASLYMAMTRAVQARAAQNKDAIQVGQSLGIFPKASDKMEITVTFELKKKVTIEVIENAVIPALDIIPDLSMKEQVSRCIDERVGQLLSENPNKP